MDSKRRMIEIKVWDQPFFSELSKTEKLFYWFVICKCDNVGVYQHNSKLAAFHCDGEIKLKSFISTLNSGRERLKILNDGSVWIKDFIRDTWGTMAAKNNLGVSCYKLLVKHGLLERFISEYPNCINIKSFRDEITDGTLDLPLPQGSPSSAPENGVSNEYEGQGSPRAGTINNSINKGINDSTDISINNPKPSLYYSNIVKELKKIIPARARTDLTDDVMEADVKTYYTVLENNGIDQPKSYIIAKAKSADWKENDWDDFDKILTNGTPAEVEV